MQIVIGSQNLGSICAESRNFVFACMYFLHFGLGLLCSTSRAQIFKLRSQGLDKSRVLPFATPRSYTLRFLPGLMLAAPAKPGWLAVQFNTVLIQVCSLRLQAYSSSSTIEAGGKKTMKIDRAGAQLICDKCKLHTLFTHNKVHQNSYLRGAYSLYFVLAKVYLCKAFFYGV